jgi:hypothetical protein
LNRATLKTDITDKPIDTNPSDELVKTTNDFINLHVTSSRHSRYLSHNSLTDLSLSEVLTAFIAMMSVSRDLNIANQVANDS